MSFRLKLGSRDKAINIPKHLSGYIMLMQLEEKFPDISWTFILDRNIVIFEV